MSDDVKASRAYDSTLRADQARRTRQTILSEAHALFVTQGYLATTVTEIAARAGVNVATLYASVGRKPTLLREVVEAGISGEGRSVPAEERGDVRAVRAADSAAEKIAVYAGVVTRIGQRTSALFRALSDAAATDSQSAELFTEITERRAENMLIFAGELRATGSLRPDLTDREVADIVWTMNSHEYYWALVHRRGWTPVAFEQHLTDAWRRLLLTD